MTYDDIPDRIQVNADTYLELITDKHAAPLLAITDANREHLQQWLPWVNSMRTKMDFLAYIERCKLQHASGTDYGYTIFHRHRPAGRIGVHHISPYNKSAAIGYWLDKRETGKGIITACCSALLELCFTTLKLERVEIKCATGNLKSAAVPKRLGFTYEGTLRHAELVNDRFLDLQLFSLLAREWKKIKSTADEKAV